MAQSRLEKIGSIYFRVTSLIKGGALKEENLPLWYSIYEAFPPKYEPKFDRPEQNIPIRNIFYQEDSIRAKFQDEFEKILETNLHSNQQSKTQKFLAEVEKLKKEGVASDKLYNKAKEEFVLALENFKEKSESRQSRRLLMNVLEMKN